MKSWKRAALLLLLLASPAWSGPSRLELAALLRNPPKGSKAAAPTVPTKPKGSPETAAADDAADGYNYFHMISAEDISRTKAKPPAKPKIKKDRRAAPSSRAGSR